MWRGVVSRACGPGLPALVEYFGEQCPQCAGWSAMEDFEVDLPFEKVVYSKVDPLPRGSPTIEGMPACACELEEIEDSDPLDPSFDAYSSEWGAHEPQQEVEAEEPPRQQNDDTQFSKKKEKGTTGRFRQYAAERAEAASQLLPVGAPLTRVREIRRMFVWKGRPPHVSLLAWRQLAESTRKSHVRWLDFLRSIPSTHDNTALGATVVRCLLKRAEQRDWKWSTLSSSLSAVASALRSIAMYTNIATPINIREDVEFAAALKRAQHLARVTVDAGQVVPPLAVSAYEELSRGKLRDASARTYLDALWHFAARAADLRQVESEDISFSEIDAKTGCVPVTIKFLHGKGAAFWGPYTVVAFVPAGVAKDLRALQAAATQNNNRQLFSMRDQRLVAAALKEGGCELRSVRLGALQYLAAIGTPDAHIQIVSQHRKPDTLMRYLGWGRLSHTKKEAARGIAVNRQQHKAASGGITGAGTTDVEPRKMGPHSGFASSSGRRVGKPPPFIPKKSPSRKDLGIDHLVDTSGWPIKAAAVSDADWETLMRWAAELDRTFKTEVGTWTSLVQEARDWCQNPEKCRLAGNRIYTSQEIPFARFTPEQMKVMWEAGKCEPHIGPILGYVKGFPAPMFKKKALRPVFEPFVNGSIGKEMLLRLAYPSRRERRAQVRGYPYRFDVDAASYFDQFKLAKELRPHFVFKTKGADGQPQLWRLATLPMGARFAPGVAQMATWVLCAPIMKMPGVVVHTMIDNIRIAASSKKAFLAAMRLLRDRLQEANISLGEPIPDDDELLRRARQPATFLGETYDGDSIANSPGNVDKLTQAWNLFQEEATKNKPGLTVRNVSSIVGLTLFMAHTLGEGLCRHHGLLRTHSRLCEMGARDGWDTPIAYLAPSLVRDLGNLTRKLLQNTPQALPVLQPPSTEAADYDLVMTIDACKASWAAQIFLTGKGTSYLLQQRWPKAIEFSATAEPRAIRIATEWAMQNSGVKPKEEGEEIRLAVITDHEAVPLAQRRWHSHYGGFSTAFDLNECFRVGYAEGLDTQYFYVEGHKNTMDAASRDPFAKHKMSVTEVTDMAMPDLKEVEHPYLNVPARDWYMG